MRRDHLTEHLKSAAAERPKDYRVIANRRQIGQQRHNGTATVTSTLGDAIREDADDAPKDARTERRRLRRESASREKIAAATRLSRTPALGSVADAPGNASAGVPGAPARLRARWQHGTPSTPRGWTR